MTTPVKIYRRQKQKTSLIGKSGQILTWTMIRVPTKAFSNQAPYPVAVVKLDNGGQCVGQIVDWQEEDLVEGRCVVAVLRRTSTEDAEGVVSYNIKFRPL